MDWDGVNPGAAAGKFVPLPTYPWQRELCWKESKQSKQDRLGNVDSGLAPYVYFNQDLGLPSQEWEVEFNDQFFPFIYDHQVDQRPVFPGAGYVDIGLCLHHVLFEQKSCVLADLNFHSMLAYEGAKLQTIHLRWDERLRQYEVHSRSHEEDAEWQLHASGRVVPNAIPIEPTRTELSELKERCTRQVSSEELYEYFDGRGLSYGDHFSRIEDFWQSEDEGEFLIRINPLHKDLKSKANQFLLHPTLLDVPIHASLKLMHGSSVVVPISIERLSFYENTNRKCWASGKVTTTSDTTWDAEMKIFDDSGELLVGVHKVKYRALPRINESREDEFYRMRWVEKPHDFEELEKESQHCLVVSNGNLLGDELCPKLEERGVRYTAMTLIDWQEAFSDIESRAITHMIYAGSWQQVDSLEEVQVDQLTQACMDLTSIIQAWVSKCGDRPLAITAVTCQSQLVVESDRGFDLTGAMLGSLGPLIENELENISFRYVDLESKADLHSLLDESFSNHEDREIAYRSDKRWIKKMQIATWADQQDSNTEKTVTTKDSVELIQTATGRLDGLKYREVERKAPLANEVEIDVCATALNFKDLMKVYGQLPASVTDGTLQGNSIGMELAGKVGQSRLSSSECGIGG